MISNSFTDYMCPICLQILIEPVVMPCEHELCRPCFKKNVEEANFVCPLCRMRISSWARRNTRKGTLVDLKRWEQIQRLFPEKCQKRLRGEDEEDLFDFPAPKRTISKDGEIRREYEEEMRKVQQAREQEMKASEEAVRQLQEEEERLVQTLDFQARQDEELARKIVSEEIPQNSQEKDKLSQTSLSRKSVTSSTASVVKGKKKNQASHGCSTLEKWFSPTRNPAFLDRQGLCKRSENKTNKTESFLTSTSMDKERFTCIFNDVDDLHYSQVLNEKKEQENQDFQLALKLQKEFDSIWKKEAMVDRKKGTVDAYLLRKTDNNSTSTQSSSSKH
ncbi:E3 ubiquitin-protein ligase RNF168 [Acropora cervicornis]|uniref:RING-type E3 ubiquitin transferase n=1 Tax=Acropora cervicornis TaxID=6130 RepID=A0AAD9VA73_ACRCE|nr:E3 ubiquitin-protein ligase RNF168 [Acropora cervicornis]